MLLWPDNEINDFENEMLEYIVSDKRAVFIYFSETIPVGFAQYSLRNDYVEGTECNPVGYLKEIFVKDEYRKRGIGKKLVFFNVKNGQKIKAAVNLQVIVN